MSRTRIALVQVEPIVGIDLGTTYSVVAALDPSGRPVTVPNRHGDLSTPSVVLFEDDGLIVGKEAQRLALLEPDRVAECAKRDMGLPSTTGRSRAARSRPQVISALVLKRLKADAERRHRPDPASRHHRAGLLRPHAARGDVRGRPPGGPGGRRPAQRADRRGAGVRLPGGLPGRGRALAGRKTVRKAVMTLVVYDLGGGTFDVTVMQIRDRLFKTLATDGDVRLGGRDWDRRIVDHAAAQLHGRASRGRPPRRSRDASGPFQGGRGGQTNPERAAEDAAGVCPPRSPGRPELSRAEFEELTADLLERTRVTTKLCLNEAGLEWPEVDKLLLSGGSTRMPQVARMLRELSGQEPDRSISPDEAVAHGAALYHGILRARPRRPFQSPGGPPQRSSTSTLHSLGLVTRTRSSNRLLNSILIPRNTPLPHSGSQVFQTGNAGQTRLTHPDRRGRGARPRRLHASSASS